MNKRILNVSILLISLTLIIGVQACQSDKKKGNIPPDFLIDGEVYIPQYTGVPVDPDREDIHRAVVGQQIKFSDKDKIDKTERNWHFGSFLRISRSPDAYHTFSDPGFYEIKLCKVTPSNCVRKHIYIRSSEEQEIPPVEVQVQEAGEPENAIYEPENYKDNYDNDEPEPTNNQSSYSNTTEEISPPISAHLNFSISRNQVEIDEVIQFRDLTSPATSVNDVYWDFGDGTTSTQSNPEHAYTTKGVKRIKFCINNKSRCIEKTIWVKAPKQEIVSEPVYEEPEPVETKPEPVIEEEPFEPEAIPFTCSRRNKVASVSACLENADQFKATATATITPKVDIQLQSIVVETDGDGVARFTYSQGGRELDEVTIITNEGRNASADVQRSILRKGKTYTLKLSGTKDSGDGPLQFKYAPSCTTYNNAELSIQFSGGAAIFNLKYCY